jgi:hypothetical protein
MSGDWGNLACPHCGAIHQPPDTRSAANDDEWIFVHLVCASCGGDWKHRVEIYRYYGVPERLPSREEDRRGR